MTTRNFEYRVSPRGSERGSRFVLSSSSDALTKGVPVVPTGAVDAQGRTVVQLATGAQAKPLPGRGGILDFERFRMDGLDPFNFTYSDADTVDPGRPVQVVTAGKIAFRNTTADSFYSREDYPTARIMVAGVSIATPTVAVGDMLTPGTGTDAAGYWAETANAANAWLVVTAVDSSTGIVEAIINF